LWVKLFHRRWGAPYLARVSSEDDVANRTFGGDCRGVYAVQHNRKTLTVDGSDAGRLLGDGHTAFGTIRSAVQECADVPYEPHEPDYRQRIVVLAGSYTEQLVIETPVDITGGGADPRDVVICGDSEMFQPQAAGQAPSGALIQWKAAGGRLCNIFVKQPALSAEEEVANRFQMQAIQVTGESLKVSECHITSEKGIGIDVRNDVGSLEIEHSIIRDCGVCGIQVGGSIVKCSIHHNQLIDNLDGVLLWRTGQGEGGPVQISDNKVFGSKASGIGVHSQSNAMVENNEVIDSGQSGIYFSDYSEGIVESNWIARSGMAGVSIKSHAKPVVRRNAILDGHSAGVYIRGHASGMIENNTILRNAKAGIGIKQHAKPSVLRNCISEGQAAAICVHRTAAGHIEGNLMGPHGGETETLWIGGNATDLELRDNVVAPSNEFQERVQEELMDMDNDLSRVQRQALTEMIESQIGREAARLDSEYEPEEAASAQKMLGSRSSMQGKPAKGT